MTDWTQTPDDRSDRETLADDLEAVAAHLRDPDLGADELPDLADELHDHANSVATLDIEERCGRHWVVRGGPGSGLYVYFVTQKGVDYVQWVEGQQ